MTHSVVHSGHEPSPRAIQSALCRYRAAGVITVGYTGLSRANSAGPGGVFRKRQLPGGLRSLMDARANGEVAPRAAISWPSDNALRHRHCASFGVGGRPEMNFTRYGFHVAA